MSKEISERNEFGDVLLPLISLHSLISLTSLKQ